MIQPGKNIIYDSSQERVSLEYLLAHTNKRYSELLKTIKHVDTSLNLQGTTWRIQGYIPLEDFKDIGGGLSLILKFSAYIGITKEGLEIWSLELEYVP
jgi:hypothetical protein